MSGAAGDTGRLPEPAPIVCQDCLVAMLCGCDRKCLRTDDDDDF